MVWMREIVRSAEVVFLLNSKNRKYRGLQPARLAAGRWAVHPASPATTRVVEHFINFFRANSTWKINFPQKKLRNIGGP